MVASSPENPEEVAQGEPAATLLIDDRTEYLATVEALFEEEGIPLDTAASWEEGVDLFRAVLHELVVADYRLPNSKNGLILLASIKPLRPSSELVLISGEFTGTVEDIIEKTDLVDAYHPKNIKLPEFLLERATEARARAAQSTSWPEVAKAHLRSENIYDTDIDRIDALLQERMSR